MTRDLMKKRLKLDEGPGPVKNGRHLPYFDCCGKFFRDCKCAVQGKLTIGYGHNLEAKGLTALQSDRMLDDDMDDAVRELAAAVPWAADLDPVRQAVLAMMAYQMGAGSAVTGRGLLGFKRTLKTIEKGDYHTAAVYMLESKWASTDSPARARRLAEMLRSGEWP